MAGFAAGGCQGVALKFRQAAMIALDLDQWQFAIMGKEPQYHDGSVSEGISSLDRGRMERFNGTFFDALRVRPIGPTMRGYLLLSFRGYQIVSVRTIFIPTFH